MNAGKPGLLTNPAPRAGLVRSIRRGLLLVMAGLLMQMLAALFWTPGTFVLAAALGVPAVALGAALFGRAAWRAVKLDDEDGNAESQGGHGP